MAYLQILTLVTLVTCFVSHTIGAIILMPLLVEVGVKLNMPVVLTISCAFAISGAMALPFSSFPNINSLMVRDDMAQAYLAAKDIVKTGAPFTAITLVLIATLGALRCVGFRGRHLHAHAHVLLPCA